MHETGLAMEIVKLAVETLEGEGFTGRVKALHLKVGRWSGAEPQTLAFALEAVCDSTELHGVGIEIETIEPTFRCGSCGGEYTAENRFSVCTQCGGAPAEFLGGDELTLDYLEIEE